MVSHFLDFSCFLNFCVAVFSFVVIVTSFIMYYLLLKEKYLLSVLLHILRLSEIFYGYACSKLLASRCGRILKFVCLLPVLQHTRPGVDNLPFAFACGLSLACKLGQLSASAHWPSAKAHSLHHQEHAQSQPRGGVFVGETQGVLGMPLGQLGEFLARCSQQLITELLHGVCKGITRIHTPLISSRVLSATPAASSCSCSSNEPLLQCLTQLGNMRTHSHPLTFPCRGNLGPRRSLLTLRCAILREGFRR